MIDSRSLNDNFKPVTALVISNSESFRNAAKLSVEPLQGITVKDACACSLEAIELVRTLQPEVVLLDVDVNDAPGIAILSCIQDGNKRVVWNKQMHVLMVTRFTPGIVGILPDAMENGFMEHVLHPGDSVDEGAFLGHLNTKVAAIVAKIHGVRVSMILPQKRVAASSSVLPKEAIMIGCSSGGPQALTHFLPRLCDCTDLPIFIVQHIHQGFTESLAESLNNRCSATVREAGNDGQVKSKHVYIAPGGFHLYLKRKGHSVFTYLSDDAPEAGCRPSINIFFRSAAEVYGNRAAAAILTGMGNDGTDGAKKLKSAGASVYVQDEQSSVVWGMPGSAVKAGVVDGVLSLSDLTAALTSSTAEKTR